MLSIKKMSYRDKLIVLSLILAVVVAVAIISGTVIAKYTNEKSVSGKIKVSAELAEAVELFEHKAQKQDGGDYALDTSEVTANDYVIMPGVDIPKDPTVRITGYTGLDAFLYVEVVEDLPDTVLYEVDEAWTALADVTGPQGGTVYYIELPSDDFEADDDGNIEVAVLKKLDGAGGNEIQVSDQLDHSSSAESSLLTFYAYLAQKTTGATAADTFEQFATVETTD